MEHFNGHFIADVSLVLIQIKKTIKPDAIRCVYQLDFWFAAAKKDTSCLIRQKSKLGGDSSTLTVNIQVDLKGFSVCIFRPLCQNKDSSAYPPRLTLLL